MQLHGQRPPPTRCGPRLAFCVQCDVSNAPRGLTLRSSSRPVARRRSCAHWEREAGLQRQGRLEGRLSGQQQPHSWRGKRHGNGRSTRELLKYKRRERHLTALPPALPRSRATSCPSGKPPKPGWITAQKSSSCTSPAWSRGALPLTCAPPTASTSWIRPSSPRWPRMSPLPWPSRAYEWAAPPAAIPPLPIHLIHSSSVLPWSFAATRPHRFHSCSWLTVPTNADPSGPFPNSRITSRSRPQNGTRPGTLFLCIIFPFTQKWTLCFIVEGLRGSLCLRGRRKFLRWRFLASHLTRTGGMSGELLHNVHSDLIWYRVREITPTYS